MRHYKLKANIKPISNCAECPYVSIGSTTGFYANCNYTAPQGIPFIDYNNRDIPEWCLLVDWDDLTVIPKLPEEKIDMEMRKI